MADFFVHPVVGVAVLVVLGTTVGLAVPFSRWVTRQK